jgi:DNA-binding NarL/FixJ family response regulator
VPGLPHSPTSIRIAIVDDHPIARLGMRRAFDSGPAFEVVCSVASFREFSAHAAVADVVILDLYLSHGRLSASEIATATRKCPVLVVSASAREQDVLAAIQAGASGYLIKSAAVEDFAKAVRVVAAGGLYLSPQLADFSDTTAAGTGGQPVSLAPRERETLSLIAQGFTQSQAATRMGVSPATVDTYIKRIRRKLGPGNKAALTQRALELGEVGAAGPAGPPPRRHRRPGAQP